MRLAHLSLAGLLLLPATACRSINISPLASRNVVPSSATREQVVSLVNRNVDGRDGQPGMTGWRCMQAKFQMGAMPMAADGTVLVSAPHNFRLRVSHPIGGGEELDVGSNPQQFWIWQKDMEALLTARHEDLPLALQHFRIPFQPDWIMEVLGVVAIDGSQYELRPAGGRQMELVADVRSVTGEPQRRIIRVDTRRGLVTAHELRAADGQPIAVAELSDHQADPSTKTVLPRKIRIHWPAAELDLRISLRHVEVNPPQFPETAWLLPHKSGCQLVDMGDYARRQAGTGSIQRVDHGVPGAPRAAAPVTGDAISAGPPQPVAGDPLESGARPFPSLSGPASMAPQAALPIRGETQPLATPGRVRLDQLNPQ